MHDAFDCVAIIEGLPLEIECIATSNKKLLVGTSKGHLLVYSVLESHKSGINEQRFEMFLERSNKAFGRKPILQLVVVESHGILISLSDGLISVHDFATYNCKNQFPKSKGVFTFSLDNVDPSSEKPLRMCTVLKRKIQTYVWRRNQFQELYQEFALPETPKTAVWMGDYLCVAMKKEYLLMQAKTGSITNLFDTGRKMEPLICPMPSGELALCRDEVTLFLSVSKTGENHQKHAVTWSDAPHDLQFSNPYIIAALPKKIEICSINPKSIVQRIDVTGTKKLVKNPFFYAASATHVWRLVPISVGMQIEQLIKSKEYEMALTITELLNNEDSLKKKKILQIKSLYAFDLFCKKKFEEAIKLFREVDKEPTYVIGLFPDLLPKEYRKQLDYPSEPPHLTQGDLEKGFVGLTEYLTQIRNKNQLKQTDETPSDDAKKMLLQIVDTSLLKCYLQTNPSMIAPLLRVKNYCHVEECEKVLVKAKKVNELVLLYQSKGYHKKALDLLLRQSEIRSSPLYGTEKTIQYLQKLGAQYVDLIFNYSKWVLKEDSENSMKIFTNDTPEIEGLPRAKVLDHLEKLAKNGSIKYDKVIKYLEHIIFDWKESGPEFHNKLIKCYMDQILPLYREYLQEAEADRRKAGKEVGELGKLRTRLIFFLETSGHYQPYKLLQFFPHNALLEEKALLLGRDGRHEEALAIYIYKLKDLNMAEQYCHKQYERSRDENYNVFVTLVKMYLQPHEVNLGFSRSVLTEPGKIEEKIEPNEEAALAVLNKHYQKMDAAQILDFLPPSIQITDMTYFLSNIIKDKMQQRRNSLVLKSLLYAEHLQVHEQRVFHQSNKCVITEERACRVCHKRIGTSAFALYPNGIIVHLYCCKDRKVCPPELL